MGSTSFVASTFFFKFRRMLWIIRSSLGVEVNSCATVRNLRNTNWDGICEILELNLSITDQVKHEH